jgi:hypothetical protein
MSPPSPQVPSELPRPQRSRPPDGEPDRTPAWAIGRIAALPNGIRLPDFCLQHSRFRLASGECIGDILCLTRRSGAEIANRRDGRLLCACSEWPRSRAAEQCDELAPSTIEQRVPSRFEDRAGILPKITYRGHGVCGLRGNVLSGFGYPALQLGATRSETRADQVNVSF